jgi:ABC-type transporter Mla MlaB component
MSMRVEGDRLLLEGILDQGTVPQFFESSLDAVRGGASGVDFSGVTRADSSAVAMALALLREAETAGRTLQFSAVPSPMMKLAQLYAVADLLGAQNP